MSCHTVWDSLSIFWHQLHPDYYYKCFQCLSHVSEHGYSFMFKNKIQVIKLEKYLFQKRDNHGWRVRVKKNTWLGTG